MQIELSAGHLVSCLRCGVTAESNIFDIIAKVGRLVEETGILVTGETERAAVQALCDANHIPFHL